MRRAVTASAIITLVLLVSCARKPEEGARAPETAVPTPAPTPVALSLPLTNPELALTVQSLPPDLVAVYNAGADLTLVERAQPERQIIVEVDPGAGPLDPESYHRQAREDIESFGGGEQVATGTVDETACGRAAWSESRYWLDGARYEEVELACPHPAGRGLLRLRAVYPEGNGDAQAELSQLQDLLGRIAAAG